MKITHGDLRYSKDSSRKKMYSKYNIKKEKSNPKENRKEKKFHDHIKPEYQME